jgi:hypothetical protein
MVAMTWADQEYDDACRVSAGRLACQTWNPAVGTCMTCLDQALKQMRFWYRGSGRSRVFAF